MSFITDKVVMDGLTYDDVLLIPAYSEVLPRTVELTTKFSRNIELKIPFVTAAMDTVTESKMAIAIAREGGIGVIHKNMSIEEQARQVAIVKRAENGMIFDPVTIKRGSTVKNALDLMAEYHIGGIPVVDDENHLVGIVTNRDLRFEREMGKHIDDVMTKENIITTHPGTDMETASQILQENKIEKLPVVDENGKEKVVKETVAVATIDPTSDYARFFDCTSAHWTKDPEYNLMFLRQQQNYANDLLKQRGHLFLNEVYDMLGINRSQAGQIMGWVYDEKNPDCDNFVDFGIYTMSGNETYDKPKRMFVNGDERAILLDFNVDGNVWKLLH